MLNAFSDTGSTPPPIAPAPVPVTPEQRGSLTTLLSGYDPSRLTSLDTQHIAARISEIGLPPKRALVFVVNTAARNAPPGTPVAHVDTSDTRRIKPQIDTGIVPLISDVVAEYRASDGSESLWSMLQTALQEAGYNPSKALVDYYV